MRYNMILAILTVLFLTSCADMADENISLKEINCVLYDSVLVFDDVVRCNIEYDVIDTDISEGILLDYKFKEANVDLNEYQLNDRLDLGCFYILNDKVWKMEATEENYNLLNEGKFPDDAVIIYQSEDIVDLLEENETGIHQSVKINGDKCEYSFYNNRVETGYYENIEWDKNKGLISYRSGYGAERDSIKLVLSE